MPRQNIIQLRKGTLAQWTANNTQVLASGEPGFETDTLRLKIGNGTTAWSGLNYVGLAGTGTSGYLPKFSSSQGVANSLVYDNGTNVGIGTTSPQALLHVNGQAYLQSLNLTGGTADRILATDTNNNVVGLNTSTYPTLTELSWVKGATSSIQTQLNNRMLLVNGFSSDINSISNGITRVYPTGNGPDGGAGHVTAFTSMQDASNNYGWQIAGYSNAFYFRHKATTFDPWYRMWTNYDFTSSNIANWNTAYGWGNHSSAGYQSASTSLTTSTNFGGDVSGAYNNIVVADDSHNHIISNVDGLQSALDLKAPLASPTFTGTPAAITAAAGTNTTQIATTAFVRTEISSLVDAAPGTLDTLNELAAALGDDPNFATTVTNSLASKISATGTANYIVKFSGSQTATNSLIFDNGTNVGVGLNSPDTKLHIEKPLAVLNPTNLVNHSAVGLSVTIPDVALDTGSGIAIAIGMNDRGRSYIGSIWDGSNKDAPDLAFYTTWGTNGVGERLRIKNDGKVGIGTSSPSYLLDVAGDAEFGSNNWLKLIDTGGNNGRLAFSAAGSIDAGGTFMFRNNAGSTEHMRITTGGDVGIGISSPSHKLHVSGVIRSTSYITSDTEFRLNNLTFARVATMDGGGGFAGGYNVYLSGSTPKHSINSPISSYYYYSDGTIRFYTNSSQSADTDASERLRISSAGDVGIGTATTPYKLNVNPASNSNNGIQILNNSAGTSARSLLSLFNGAYGAEISVGGTSFINDGFYRQNRLLISGPFITDYVTGQHVFSIGGGVASQAVSGSTSVGLWDINALTVYNELRPTVGIAGGTLVGSSLTLKSTTNVGTTDHIKLVVGNNGATEAVRVINNGNVGIGTTTPSYKLQVNGSFAASTKSFRINHPSKKDHSLEYGSLESPYHGVRLTGRGKLIKGVGVVSLPDYLKDLIHDDDTLNIQITNIKHGKTIYIDKIDLQNDQFIVKVDRAKSLGELQFCWTLSGVRKDVDHLVVEKEN